MPLKKATSRIKKKRPPLWGSWYSMFRCCTGRAPAHAKKLYEGIGFCPEWRDYRSFENWAFATGWKKGMVLTRRDKNGDFSPENCFWATRGESNGWRSVVRHLVDGRTVRDIIGCQSRGTDKKRHAAVSRRIFSAHWDVKRASAEPIHTKHIRRLPDGRTLREAIGQDADSKRYCLIADRVFRLGYTLSEALSRPKRTSEGANSCERQTN